MNTIFTLLFCSFILTALSGGLYPLLVYYISEFSRWHKPMAVVFWLSWLAGAIFAFVAYIKVMAFYEFVNNGGF